MEAQRLVVTDGVYEYPDRQRTIASGRGEWGTTEYEERKLGKRVDCFAAKETAEAQESAAQHHECCWLGSRRHGEVYACYRVSLIQIDHGTNAAASTAV